MISDREIDEDIAEIKAVAAWYADRKSIFKAAAVCGKLGKKYGGEKNEKDRERFYAKLPFARSTFYKLVKIHGKKKLMVPNIQAKLPTSFTALDETARLPDKLFDKAIANGKVHPEATAAEIKAYRLANTDPKPRKHSKRLLFCDYDPEADADLVKVMEEWRDRGRLQELVLKPIAPMATTDKGCEAPATEQAAA